MRNVNKALLATVLFGFSPTTGMAQDLHQTLEGSVGTDGFGHSLAIDGEFAVIGARAGDAGEVHVFRLENAQWIHEAVFESPNGHVDADEAFGCSVAIEGDTIAVGEPGDPGESWKEGVVWIYRRSSSGNWMLDQEIRPDDSHGNQNFGWAVELDGPVVIAGAREDNEAGSQSGAVYVFRDNGSFWDYETKLTATDPQPRGLFGQAVSIQDGVLAVGAHGQDSIKGSVYVFRYQEGTWEPEAKLEPTTSHPQPWFGWAVSTNGERILVGSPQEDSQNGAAYVFRFSGEDWQLEQKLAAEHPEGPFPFFGSSVGVSESGDLVAVGAPSDGGDPGEPHGHGAYHLFEFHTTNGWTEEGKVFESDAGSGDSMGAAIDLDAQLVVSGAPGKYFGPSAGTGVVYIYELQSEADEDGDGTRDTDDSCPDSNLSPTVMIEGCDSGVGNALLEAGCSMMDLILLCLDGIDSQADSPSCVSHLTNNWKAAGLITGDEKGAIQSCAGVDGDES